MDQKVRYCLAEQGLIIVSIMLYRIYYTSEIIIDF